MWLDEDTLNEEQDARLRQFARHVAAAQGDPSELGGRALCGLDVQLENSVLVVQAGYAFTAGGGLMRLPSTVLQPLAGAASGADVDVVLASDGDRGVVVVRSAVGTAPPAVAPGEVALCRITVSSVGGHQLAWRWSDRVTAAGIVHPDRRSRLTLGPIAEHPSRALTVEVGHAEVTSVDDNGIATMSASCAVSQGLEADNRIVLSRPTAPPPQGARPWALYRVAAVPPAPPNQPGSGAQLRVELGEVDKGTKPESRRFTVARQPSDPTKPQSVTLSVDAGGTVTVAGDLAVEGVLVVPGGTAADAALRYLARRAAELMSEANSLLNPPAAKDLTISNTKANFSGTNRMTLTVGFDVVPAVGVDLENVFVYMVIAGGGRGLYEGFEGQDVTIPSGQKHVVTRPVDVTTVQPGDLVQVDVVAVGRSTALGGAGGRRSDTWHTQPKR
jgi:hypothetical protein